jgi:16S rRNA (cytosine1402-N4)-methyltransferase
VLRRFGDVKRPKAMAVAMKEERLAGALNTTRDLAALCDRVLSDRRRSHPPATLVFQALRIAVNDELGQLQRLLDELPRRLSVGGVAVAITFHSLEDRAVKHAFRALTQPQPLPRGIPVRGDVGATPFDTVVRSATASRAEADGNPRSRSARLRAVRRVRDEVCS